MDVDETNHISKPWIEFAKAKFHNSCKIIVDPGSSTGIAEALPEAPKTKKTSTGTT